MYIWKLLLLNSPLFEGAKLLFELPGATLGKTWAQKSILKFLVHSTDIMGLAELVDAGLGVFHYNLELGVTHGQV